MCLEDQFIVALYNQPGSVEVEKMAQTLGVSVNALLSIMNRVMANYPEFIILEKCSDDNSSQVCINRGKESNIRSFLDSGGFTAINEKEFEKYNKKIFLIQDMLPDVKQVFKKVSWRRWATGLGVLGAGLAVTVVLKSIKDAV